MIATETSWNACWRCDGGGSDANESPLSKWWMVWSGATCVACGNFGSVRGCSRCTRLSLCGWACSLQCRLPNASKRKPKKPVQSVTPLPARQQFYGFQAGTAHHNGGSVRSLRCVCGISGRVVLIFGEFLWWISFGDLWRGWFCCELQFYDRTLKLGSCGYGGSLFCGKKWTTTLCIVIVV